MLDIEVIGGDARLGEAAEVTLRMLEVIDGHVAIEIVDEARIIELNTEHRDKPSPTDVLSFPIDETTPPGGPRELGDVVICPEHTEHLDEAVIHGVLHLCGYDHETDNGEMLEIQGRILDRLEFERDSAFE